MIFTKVILPIFILKIFFHPLQADLVIDNTTEIETRNLLIQFLTDLREFIFKKLPHDRLMVLGKRVDFLDISTVLLKINTPYTIGTKPDATIHASEHSGASVVLLFIDGFNELEVSSVFAKLPNSYVCKTLIISMDENTRDYAIKKTIVSAIEMKSRNVLFARFDGKIISVYGHRLNHDCSRVIALMNTWTPRNGFENRETVLGYHPVPNENGCPMFVSTFELPPMMMLRDDADGTHHIKGGVEGRLVESIAKYLNMRPVIKVPWVKEKLLLSSTGNASGIIGDVASGVANFGIGQIRPTLERLKRVDLTTPYSSECMIWTVPRIVTEYGHSIIISEFLPATWLVVILSVFTCCGLVHAIPIFRKGTESQLKIFDVIAMTLSYSIPRQPSRLFCRLVVLVYLHYSRVICTAYSTSLASILTTDSPGPAIVDHDGIITAGLRTTGTAGSRDMLAKLMSPNDPRMDLLNRYEIVNSTEEAMARLVQRRDVAYLRHYSTINYQARKLAIAGKPIGFYPLSGCVISYNSVMITTKGSHLTGFVNNIIMRLREAGIDGHWKSLDGTTEFHVKPIDVANNNLEHLSSIFFLYLACLIPAFLVFFTELLAHRLKLNWFTI